MSAVASGENEQAHASSVHAPPIALLRAAQQDLRNADAAKQTGEPLQEFEAHNALGLLFEQAGLLPYTAREYQKCLAIATDSDFLEGRMATHLALGTGVSSFLGFWASGRV
jgi:hypothetical protein